MLTLLTFPGSFVDPSDSPFCTKAMCLLNMSELVWKPKFISDPRKTPKGKLPVLLDGDAIIADSHQIQLHLQNKHGITFNTGLSEQERILSHALIRMTEENLYFALLCDRWMNDANWEHVKTNYFASVPWPLRGIISKAVRKQALSQARGQGIGLHDDGERFARAKEDVKAIQATLDDKAFLFGKAPTAADAAIGPVLSAIARTPVSTALSEYVSTDSQLIGYVARVRDTLFTGPSR